MILAVLSCFPLGLVGGVLSAEARVRLAGGDRPGARRAARRARTCCHLAFAIAAAVIVAGVGVALAPR